MMMMVMMTVMMVMMMMVMMGLSVISRTAIITSDHSADDRDLSAPQLPLQMKSF